MTCGSELSVTKKETGYTVISLKKKTLFPTLLKKNDGKSQTLHQISALKNVTSDFQTHARSVRASQWY